MPVKLTGVNWRKLKSLIFIKLNECKKYIKFWRINWISKWESDVEICFKFPKNKDRFLNLLFILAIIRDKLKKYI